MMRFFLQFTMVSMLWVLSSGASARIIDNVAIAKETMQLAQAIDSIKAQERDVVCLFNLNSAETATKKASNYIYASEYTLARHNLVGAFLSLTGDQVQNCLQKSKLKELSDEAWRIHGVIAGLDTLSATVRL